MNNIKDIQKIILARGKDLPDTVYVREKENLLLLNYKPKVQYDNLWTPFELMSRGLILNKKTGEVVARPFDKFFNWGENGRETTAQISIISEKVDGSLGIHYRLNREIFVATRGSFESEQAFWATEHLNRYHNIKNLPVGWTLLFEIVYPDNKVVIDYEGWSGLVLLAIRNRFTGNYMPNKIVKTIAKEFGFKLPQQYEFSSPQEIIKQTETLPASNEGWVVEFKDGQRFKFKGKEYKKLHKIISGFTFKLVLEHHQNGTIGQIKSVIPDELYKELDGWVKSIDETIETVTGKIEQAYKLAPKTTRKEYAIWIQKNVPELLKYMFSKLDNKDLLPLIYKFAF